MSLHRGYNPIESSSVTGEVSDSDCQIQSSAKHRSGNLVEEYTARNVTESSFHARTQDGDRGELLQALDQSYVDPGVDLLLTQSCPDISPCTGQLWHSTSSSSSLPGPSSLSTYGTFNTNPVAWQGEYLDWETYLFMQNVLEPSRKPLEM